MLQFNAVQNPPQDQKERMHLSHSIIKYLVVKNIPNRQESFEREQHASGIRKGFEIKPAFSACR